MPNKPLIVAIVGAIAVAGAILVNVMLSRDEAKTPPTAAGQATGKAAPAHSQVNILKPSFDVVRVDPDGDAVMAGRALPGSTVIILDNGQPIGKVIADGRGEWVFVPTKPLLPGSRQLTLEMRSAGTGRKRWRQKRRRTAVCLTPAGPSGWRSRKTGRTIRWLRKTEFFQRRAWYGTRSLRRRTPNPNPTPAAAAEWRPLKGWTG